MTSSTHLFRTNSQLYSLKALYFWNDFILQFMKHLHKCTEKIYASYTNVHESYQICDEMYC